MAFSNTFFKHSVTEELDFDLSITERDRDERLIKTAVQRKGDTVLRTVVANFAPDDRGPAAMYRLIATNFPYAGAVPAVNDDGNNWYSAAQNPTISVPTFDLTNMSLFNISTMIDDYNQYAQSVLAVSMQGLEFVKGDLDELRLFSDSSQTDISELYNTAYAVTHACSHYTFAKYSVENAIMRAKTAYLSVMCGKGVEHFGADPDPIFTSDKMANEPNDTYGIAAQADSIDMQRGDFPKGAQAFAHPRVIASVDHICARVRASYEKLLLVANEVRRRVKHLCSVLEGPHGSIFRNMRDHALISQLTRWMRPVNCYFATFHPMSAIIVDTNMTATWQETVEQQWRELPEMLDELHIGGISACREGRPRALRMPPVHLLMKLKLSYDFHNRTYMRSLLTHADTFLYKSHIGVNASTVCVGVQGNVSKLSRANAICMHGKNFAEGCDDLVEIAIDATDNIDPDVKSARFTNIPNGLFMSNAFNEDTVALLMDRVHLRTIMQLMFTSRVFYQLCSKNEKFWTVLSNLFLIKHRGKLVMINGDRMLENIKFRPRDLPRFDGGVFEHHYYNFYCLQATLTINYKSGNCFCVYCLKQSEFRSELLGGVVCCTSCYGKFTISAKEGKQKVKFADREWFRQASCLRTLLPWKLDHRPTRGNRLHMDVVFSREAYDLTMMQMTNLSRALSPQIATIDLKERLQDTPIRYLFGGPHAQLLEPPVVKLCSNFYKYSARQYGVSKVHIENGYSHEGIRRFMGEYSKPRTPYLEYHAYGPDAKKIFVKHNTPDVVDLSDDVNYPYYYRKHIEGHEEVFRVNRPFSVMTASQPPKICGVVALNSLHAGDANSSGLPLCAHCYNRAFSLGLDNMMVESDSEEDGGMAVMDDGFL